LSQRLTVLLKENDNITLEDLDKKAKELTGTRTDLVIKALKVIMEFDADFIKQVDRIAVNLKRSFAEVIQGFVTKRLAEIDAKSEVWGLGSVKFFELIRAENGALKQKDLYEWLKEERKSEENQKKINLLIGQEARGIPLTDSRKEFLIQNKIGQVYFNSEQYRKDQDKKEFLKELSELNQKAVDGELTEKEEKKLDLLLLKLKNFE
jgi:hypothetical protein